MVSRDGGAARLAVVFDSDPLGAPAIDHLRTLRDRMPRLLRSAGLSGARVVYGGQTALADDTVTRVLDDLARVAVVAVLVNLLLLALFMRALVAPLYLVASSILGLLATIGADARSSSRASSARTTSPTTSRSPPPCCSSRWARTTTSSSPGASGRRRGACACARRSPSPRRRPRAR